MYESTGKRQATQKNDTHAYHQLGRHYKNPAPLIFSYFLIDFQSFTPHLTILLVSFNLKVHNLATAYGNAASVQALRLSKLYSAF